MQINFISLVMLSRYSKGLIKALNVFNVLYLQLITYC